jgi:hypothetical protein
MHSTVNREMAMARIADLHQHAAWDRVAQTVVLARRPHKQRRARPVPGHTITGLARRVLTLLGARPSPTR